MLNSCCILISMLVIQCLAMFNNNKITERLLIEVLGANFVLLFLIAWHVVVVALLFYVHGKHLRSCQNGQLT